MASLPGATSFTGDTVTEATFKTNFTQLIGYLGGLLGTSGTTTDALTTLGAASTTYVDNSKAPSGRNLITNGAFQINQETLLDTDIQAATGYPVDCWGFQPPFGSSNNEYRISSRSTGGPDNLTYFKIYMQSAFAGSTSTSTPMRFYTGIEGIIAKKAQFGTASAKILTLSFKVKSSVVGTYNIAIKNAFTSATKSYVTTYNIDNANTWETKTITLSQGCTGGTWSTTEGSLGIVVVFAPGCLGTAGELATTADTWLDGNYSWIAGVNFTNNAGATWNISNVQLEVGSSATPFEALPFIEELNACRRYVERSYAYGAAIATTSNNSNRCSVVNLTGIFTGIPFLVEKCKAPNIAIYNSLGTVSSGNVWNIGTSTVVAASAAATRRELVPSVAGVTNSMISFEYIASARII
jgi:hypothetical protein